MTSETQHADLPRCDLVMKGGVSSGVVYPPVIAELAQKYRFERIGGTSAGAIAAAITAAAEYGRQRGRPDTFEALNELSHDISEPGKLLTLFQASAPPHLLPLLTTLLPLVSNPAAAEGQPAVAPSQPGGLSGLARRIAPELLALLSLSRTPAAGGDQLSDTVRGVVESLPEHHPGAYADGVEAGALAGVRVGQYAIGAALVLTLLFAVPLWMARAGTVGWLAWAVLGALLVGAAFLLGRTLSQAGSNMGGTLAAGADLARLALYGVPDNLFGICTGHAPQAEPGAPPAPALTDWLDGWIRRVAGDTTHGGPLTFADLERHDVFLQMVTTNLSLGRPYILPFPTDLILLFRRGDAELLFPGDIVNYMCDDAHLYPGWSLSDLNRGVDDRDPERFYMLPLGDALPVLVGMRMSLSFPVLISALRLYTVSATCPQVDGEYRPRSEDLQPNWFSDGGICSNFPIHFFDAWLPTHPTFGINLTALPRHAFAEGTQAPEPPDGTVRVKGAEADREPDSVLPGYISQIAPDAPVAPLPSETPTDEDYLRDTLLGVQAKSGAPPPTHMPAPSSARVLLPDAEQPLDPLWRPVESLSRFLWSMFDTAMNYRDTTQLMLPSYKERAVQIRLDGTREGGLNLNMPEETVLRLQEYGREAGALLRDKFDFDRHRWVRFRVLMGELERQILSLELPLRTGPAEPDPQGPTAYEQLLAIARAAGFPFAEIAEPEWVSAADTRLRALRALIEVWHEANREDAASGMGEQRVADLSRVLVALTEAWQQPGLDSAESQRRAEELIATVRDWPAAVQEGPHSHAPSLFFKPVADAALDLRVTPRL